MQKYNPLQAVTQNTTVLRDLYILSYQPNLQLLDIQQLNNEDTLQTKSELINTLMKISQVSNALSSNSIEAVRLLSSSIAASTSTKEKDWIDNLEEETVNKNNGDNTEETPQS